MKKTVSVCVSLCLTISLGLVPPSFGQYRGIEKYRKHEQNNAPQLARFFDALDFDVLSHHQWNKLSASHAKHIRVYWPDGRRTIGLDKHTNDLKALFAYAPDARIRVHPVKFGSDDWTCVIGEMEGTFTRPMRTPNGKTVPPTGKRFKIRMCSVGHWNKNGIMDEEYLFWDNDSLLRQLGINR